MNQPYRFGVCGIVGVSRIRPPAFPEPVTPMVAAVGSPVGGTGWAAEFEWGGMRCTAYTAAGEVRLLSRSGRDITAMYPELTALPAVVAGRCVGLDGELVALDAVGRPSLGRLQQRMQHGAAGDLPIRAPVVYYVFDLLYLDGMPTMPLPYRRRRDLLAQLGPGDAAVRVSPHYVDADLRAVMAQARAQGADGIVTKRMESAYWPGRRSRDWIKALVSRTREFVIVGYTSGSGRRTGRIGSLLLAVSGPDGRLSFAGGVGAGLTDQMLDELWRLLAPLARATTSVADAPREYARGVHWVEPVLVAEVAYHDWTDAGRLRHPCWRRLIPGKSFGAA